MEIAEARRIDTVTINKAIYPSTDEEKFRRNVIDVDGNPKQPKRPLSMGVKHILRELEIYNREHDCDLCRGTQKSIRIVLIEDTLTGETFRVAGDCLDYHFNVDIQSLEAGSQGLRSLLDSLSEQLQHYSNDTTTALDYALEHFDELVSFLCPAVEEAKKVLMGAKNNPDGAAEGRLDEDLTAIRLLVKLQQEAKTQPELFKARWEAAKAHPRFREVGVNLNSLETIMYRPSELKLEQVSEVNELLRVLRNHPPELKNAIEPWQFPDVEIYKQELEAHYLEEANQAPKVSDEGFDVQNKHLIVKELIREARRFPQKLIITSPERHYVESFDLDNYEHCETTLGTSIYRLDLGKKGETNLVYTRGIVLWRPDAWSEAYPLWRLHGKEKLERLEPSSVINNEEVTAEVVEPSISLKTKFTATNRKRAKERAELREKEEAFIEAELPRYSPRVKYSERGALAAKLGELYRAESQSEWANADRIRRELPPPVYEGQRQPTKTPQDVFSTIEDALRRGESDET